MLEEWKIKGTLLQELDDLRGRVAQLEQAIHEKIEEAAKDSGQSFAQFFDNAVEGMLLADMESKQFLIGNKAICRMLGWHPEEVIHLRIMDIYPREDLDYVIRQLEKQARGESAPTKNIPVQRKDGVILYADINSFPVTLAGRTYLMSAFREILPRKGKSILQQINYGDSYKGKPLTASEMRIFELIANGMSNKEIASLLHRSVRTIEWHRSHIIRKLNVDNPADLIKQAALMGLVDLPEKRRLDETP